MHIRSLILGSLVALALVGPSSAAVFGCKDYVEVTPNTDPVYGTKITTAGSAGASKGSSYDIATFCPRVHAAGTCGGVTLSEKVQGNADYNAYLGAYGNVDDIETHRKTLLGIPFGPHLEGSCGA